MKKILLLNMFVFFLSCKKSIQYGDIKLSKTINPIEVQDLKKNDNDTIRIKGNLSLSMRNTCINSKGLSVWIKNLKPAINKDYKFGDDFHKKIDGKDVDLIGIYKYRKYGNLNLYDGKLTQILYLKIE